MKRGITFLTIVIAVVIMLIFASTATISIINVSNNSSKTKIATEYAYVQEAVNNYYNQNNDYPTTSSVTVDLQNVNNGDLIQFNLEDNKDNKIILYQIDLTLLGNLDLVYGKESQTSDIYAVSKKTGNIYYLQGVKIGSKTYFTLTDELKEIINYVDKNESTVTLDGISFVPSTKNWTNKKIATKVLIPNKYTNVTVSVVYNSTNKNYNNYNEVNSFNQYYIDDIEGNYVINVAYNNGQNQTFNVSNFDNVAPVVSISNKVDIVAKDGNESYSYVSITNKSDDLSGIKYIKYEKEKIETNDIATYFKTNGIELQKDIIEFDNTTKNITVYVEDNAGNYSYARIDVSN